jgi:ACS family hexuronate transporter-like MFS transporter
VWFVAWQIVYQHPSRHPWLTENERPLVPSTPPPGDKADRTRWASLLPLRQTWAYALAKSLTDPVWWFFLFWLPKFLAESYNIRGVAVVPYLTVVYVCADIGSLTSGYVSSALIKRGWSLNAARKTTFAAIAVLITPILIATAFTTNPVAAIALIACATGLHQAWSAIVWTLPTDLFPSRATGSASGIGACLASVAAIVTAEVTGRYLTAYPGSYAPLFLGAACLYPLALVAVHLCSPKMEPARV